MRIDILTVVPEILDGPFSQSIIGRAQKKALPKYIFTTCAITRQTNIAVVTIMLSAEVQGWL